MNPQRRRKNRILSLLAWFGGALVTAAATEQPGLRAGADRTDVTPNLGILMLGGFVSPEASHVHDPLHVRTLVLDDGTTRLAFVVVDSVAVPRVVCDEAKRLVHERSGLPKSHVAIAATHTHSSGTALRMGGPDLTQWLDRDGHTQCREPLTPYQEFLIRRIADSVQNAINRLEPARLGWGVGQVPEVLGNRRWFLKSEGNLRNPFGGVDRVRMNPPAASPDLIEPAGPVDPEVSFLSVQTRAGRPLALLANFGLHYVGGVRPRELSADYFGLFAERIGELLGAGRQDPAFVGIMSNGTSADVIGRDARTRPVAEQPYVKMQRVANIVAAEVYRVYQSVEHKDDVKLDVRYEELPLQPRRAPPEMVAHARRILAGRPADEKPWHSQERTYAELVRQSLEAPDILHVPVQAFRVGEVGIAVTPAETFAEMGLELKARTPFAKTFTLSLANAWYGYMPTVRQHELGGYETWFGINRLEKEAAPKMTEALLRMMASMR